ncbi:transcriptional regulator, AraC family [Clostridiales bacterium oral taxon 876 str. F0540]|nr:transcriptional regulator, AraC family [Clostridiales bacterium oral taxon 876 str. F0540]
MNYVCKYDRNFAAISDSVRADSHRHWLLQMFLGFEKELNIEVDGKLIICNAIIVNMNTLHKFNTDEKIHFTMLINPTSEMGRVVRGMLKDQSFYVFPYEETVVMQQNFKNALLQRNHNAILSFIQSINSKFASRNTASFDERIVEVLSCLNDCLHEDEFHQIKYLSQKICLSESRLAHLFKEETGIPLKSYIVLHKLQSAYELIFKGENITAAALHAGFDSPSHLAYTNKIMTGMSTTNIIRDSEFLKVF